MSNQNYKLKVHLEALESIQLMSEKDWLNGWAEVATCESVYLTKDIWEEYLKDCIIQEVFLMNRNAI